MHTYLGMYSTYLGMAVTRTTAKENGILWLDQVPFAPISVSLKPSLWLTN